MTAYLVSIAIPTHNRSRYAISCIQGLLDIESNLLQVVVHDTSNDDCELRAWAYACADRRLVYRHCADRLSMTENHERVVAMAEGEYVCLIGDDDCVSSLIVDVARYARERDLACVVPKISASYSWPDFRTRVYSSVHAGRVYLDRFDGRLQERKAPEALRQGLAEPMMGTDHLPKLYHGLVQRRVLERLVVAQGRLFAGTSPDMSAAIALATALDRYWILDVPFTLPGASGGSNTGRSALNKHKGDLRTDPHMAPFRDLDWPGEIPAFFSVETVWSQALWETLRLTGKPELLDEVRLDRLYGKCLVSHPGYRALIWQAFHEALSRGRPVSRAGVLRACVRYRALRMAHIFRRLRHPGPSNGKEVLGPFGTVRAARAALDARLDGVDWGHE